MEYTAEELKKWWKKLPRWEKTNALDRLPPGDFRESLKKQHKAGWTFSPRQLAIIRKYN